MSATLKVFRRLLIESGAANPIDYGSIVASQQDTAIAGTPRREMHLTLAPGDSAVIWDWTDDGDFVLMLIECSGYAWIEQLVDSPTDAENDDFTASGTAENRPKEGISCYAPLFIQGMAVPVVPDSGGAQTNYEGSSFHASTVNGRRYQITAKNPDDAEESITLTVVWTL